MNSRQRRAWEAREMAGLSIPQVAVALGKSRSTVHAWEANSSPRTADDIVALCRLYGITTDWYLEGRGPMRRPRTVAGQERDNLVAALERLSPAQQAALAQLVQTMLP